MSGGIQRPAVARPPADSDFLSGFETAKARTTWHFDDEIVVAENLHAHSGVVAHVDLFLHHCREDVVATIAFRGADHHDLGT